MNKKITCLSMILGTILYVLVFICQFFFKIYSNAMNLKGIFITDALFLAVYWIIVYILVFCWKKNVHKILLYALLPFFLSLFFYIASEFYYSSHHPMLSVESFLFFYLAAGYWTFSIFSGIIDLGITFFLNRKKSAPINCL